MQLDEIVPNDPVVAAQQMINEGHGSLLQALPTIIKFIIRHESWKGRRKGPTEDGAPFTSFKDFVEYKQWWGLECPWDKLMLYCESDKECHDMLLRESTEIAKLEAATVKRGGANNPEGLGGKSGKKSVHKIDNRVNATVDNDRNDRNQQSGLLRRLAKQGRTDLLDRVASGELSPNAAAVEAGLRRRMRSIPVDSPNAAIQALLKVFTVEQLLSALTGPRA
jgi:hypothetical protein